MGEGWHLGQEITLDDIFVFGFNYFIDVFRPKTPKEVEEERNLFFKELEEAHKKRNFIPGGF